jgi:hypothetical protein
MTPIVFDFPAIAAERARLRHGPDPEPQPTSVVPDPDGGCPLVDCGLVLGVCLTCGVGPVP